MHLRRPVISLASRCPRCKSEAVFRERRHRYLCERCGRRFVGYRLGRVRLAF